MCLKAAFILTKNTVKSDFKKNIIAILNNYFKQPLLQNHIILQKSSW